jgi:hypothetical protein
MNKFLFSSRQVPEIILNESSKNIAVALIETTRLATRYLPKTRVYVTSLVLSQVFKTVFEAFLASLVGLISVK